LRDMSWPGEKRVSRIMEKLKVLVAEDDKATQKLYDRFLTEEIFDLRLAKTGGEALEIYRTWQPELIILDLMLPEISGYSVLKEIREDLENKTIPIIISSSLSKRDDILSCAKFGIQGYFTKPVIWKEIGLRVLECFQKTHPETADRVTELRKQLEAKREFKERPNASVESKEQPEAKGESPEQPVANAESTKQPEAKAEPKEQPDGKAEPTPANG
jgi:DNA-binding response OmpR family regulator